ncbi:MAG: hypothetical protein WB676_11005 [Bryobacteraceae bacterium]
MTLRNTHQVLAMALLTVASVTAQNTTLTSFVDSKPYEGVYIERLFYLDQNQSIQELYNYGGWLVQNPTLDSGAQVASQGSALTSFYDSFGIQHMFYVDASLNVHELYNDGQWWNNRLTGGTTDPRNNRVTGAATNAPGARDQLALTSCFDNHNIEHVFYIDPVNHVRELKNNGQWASDDVTAATNTPGAAYESGLTSFCDSSGDPNVFYTTGNLNHIEWLIYAGGQWQSNDITGATNGPAAAFANALTSFFDSFGIGHVFYLESSQNVRELYMVNGRWFGNSLTADTDSPVAASEGGLTSFFDTYGIEHVFYIDISDHVRELYNNGQWQTNNLTADTNSPAPAHASALTSFFDSQGEHVFYVDTIDHIIELYNTNGPWQSKDLTAATTAPLATP